jgi:hypothetical protein
MRTKSAAAQVERITMAEPARLGRNRDASSALRCRQRCLDVRDPMLSDLVRPCFATAAA